MTVEKSIRIVLTALLYVLMGVTITSVTGVAREVIFMTMIVTMLLENVATKGEK